MRALVTGGAGLVGSEIVDALLNRGGVEVVSIDNYSAGTSKNLEYAKNFSNFTEFRGDIRDQEFLKSIFDSGFDWVFHEAVSKNTICLVDPLSDLSTNAAGTLSLLQFFRASKSGRFIHASTGSVYGRTSSFPTAEDTQTLPVSFYGNSKLAAENYVRLFYELYGIEMNILRYFHVFGSRQDSSKTGGVVPHFINLALNDSNIEVTGDGNQIRAFTHVSDIARINLLCAESALHGQIVNCASDARVSINSLAEKVLKLIPLSKSRIVHTPERLGDIYKFDISTQKLQSGFGFKSFRDFDNSLELTIQEFIKQK
jgi:UDP-glucose 4-epimerase